MIHTAVGLRLSNHLAARTARIGLIHRIVVRVPVAVEIRAVVKRWGSRIDGDKSALHGVHETMAQVQEFRIGILRSCREPPLIAT